MSTSKTKFTEAMARSGFDPRGEHPTIKPQDQPEYLGNGKWGAPVPIRDTRVPDPDDDKGYGPDEDDSWMDGK